jgi:hypothetical protein
MGVSNATLNMGGSRGCKQSKNRLKPITASKNAT